MARRKAGLLILGAYLIDISWHLAARAPLILPAITLLSTGIASTHRTTL